MTPRNPVDDAVRVALDALPGGPVGVACSGGVDSIALAHAVIAGGAGREVVIVHVDHQLREDSARVAAEVGAWATGQGAAVELRQVIVEPTASLEDAARRARYAALDDVIAVRGLVGLMTAHTARDQAETVIMRVMRGSGPAGLAGIPRRRGRYVRPLLAGPRAATEAHVAAHGLPTWPDPMNDDPRFARVRLRALWPQLVAENPALDDALLRLARNAAEWTDVVDAAAEALGDLDCTQLAAAPPAIAKRAIQIAAESAGLSLGADHLDAVLALAERPTGGTVTIDVPGGRATRTYDRLGLASTGAAAPAGDAGPELEVITAPGATAIRAAKPGDRMRPARLRGRSRKLSDLYVDARVPRADRVTARVVVDAATDEILWAEHLGPAFNVAIEVVARAGAAPTRNPR
jgi:tRNA(Ile)-lysidine synthase